MISINEHFIDSAAPSADAARNGRDLVAKNKFVKFHHSADGSLLFGSCQGSGKEPYLCSADFAAPETPVYRCTCPSRQFPCKHSLGLLFAYATARPFTAADIPDTLAAKRTKAAARVDKKEAAEQPRTVNKSALTKKIKTQLEGIDLLEKLTWDLIRLGIGNMNAKSAGAIESQAKQLGDAYLPGAQAALHSYTHLFSDVSGDDHASAGREAIYSEAVDQLGRLHSLVKQGRAYLTRRLKDPELAPETDTAIAAWLGHVWQLRELKDAGLVKSDVELVQLAFHLREDSTRREFVDTGIWMNLASGQIQLTQTFRPYKAQKFIKSEDSFFDVAQVTELCVYPGDVNPRVRWEGMASRPLKTGDFQRIRSHANSDFASVIKQVKTQIKGPLADKQPVYALNFRYLGRIGDALIAEDAAGERLVLTDLGLAEEPASCHLLPLLSTDLLKKQTLIARFRHDLDSRKLQIKPLSIVTYKSIVRLTF